MITPFDKNMKAPRSPRHFFTPSEDALLSEIMKNKDVLTWEEVAERIPNRTFRQCRERWVNYLAPSIKRGEWTNEEDNIIIEYVQKFGTKWAKLSKIIQGRTDNDIKNRWYSPLSKILKEKEYTKSTFDFWTEIDSASCSFMDFYFNLETLSAFFRKE
jgi:hypothetical protein